MSIRTREGLKTRHDKHSRKKRVEIGVVIRKQDKAAQMNRFRAKIAPGLFLSEGELKKLPLLVTQANSDVPDLQLQGVTELRKMLAIERNPPIEQVVKTGIVRRLVQLLTSPDPKIQFESAWVLTNIASGTSQHTRHVIEHGAIGILIKLLMSPSEEVREQAVWALGNIAGDSPDYRDLVLQSGIMRPLLDLCVPHARTTTLRTAAWALANLCRGKKPEPPFQLIHPALPTLAKLIHARDEEILADTCWALSYVSDDSTQNNRKIAAVLRQPGIARRLVELLTWKNPSVTTPALRTVGNIITGDDSQTQAMIDQQVIPCLTGLLCNPKRSIRKEACWTISNITAGTTSQIDAVISAGLIPHIVTVIRTDQFEVQKEAAWVISNATSGGKPPQLKALAQTNVVAALSEMLKCSDPRIILVCMEAIENILKMGKREADAEGVDNRFALMVEECGGLDTLEQLQRHETEEVYEKAVNMIQAYFGEDSDGEQAVDGSSFAFTPSVDQRGSIGLF